MRHESPAECRGWNSLEELHDSDSSDIFDKCERFGRFVDGLPAGLIDNLELVQSLDHRIKVAEPGKSQSRELVCFDSSSYLGLHVHPRILAAARRALDEGGAGVPTAQRLAGTHRWLRELEDTIAAFHRRPAAIVFASDYLANVGTLTALLRSSDFVARDRFCHAGIHDGCRWSGARLGLFRHRNVLQLEVTLRDAAAGGARLVVSDGVFGAYGGLAPLPELRATADRYGARLLIDEADSVGVIGSTGRGLEEYYTMPGSIDVVMGSLSKAAGGVGGYVCGSTSLIRYLRFIARVRIFTASLPPATCAALSEAFRVMESEPEHLERLWRVSFCLWERLANAGFVLRPLESPVITIRVGSTLRLLQVNAELRAMGLKCNSVFYPAVPEGQGQLRLMANARHTDEDLDRAVAILTQVARRYKLLGDRGSQFRACDDQSCPC